MPREAKFRVSMPPSANSLFLYGRNKRLKSPLYTKWLRQAGWELHLQKVRPVPIGDVHVKIRIGPRIKRADLDNRLKALMDLAVSHDIIRDDKYVLSYDVAWDDTVDGAEVLITSTYQAPVPKADEPSQTS